MQSYLLEGQEKALTIYYSRRAVQKPWWLLGPGDERMGKYVITDLSLYLIYETDLVTGTV